MAIVKGIAGTAGGTNTSDATAAQWDIKSGKTAYLSGGKVTGTGYFPAMMQFDGSSGFYSDTYTSSGNKITLVARFSQATFTGGASKLVCKAIGPSNRGRGQIAIVSNDHATAGRRNRVLFQAQNSAGTVIAQFISINTFGDGELHTVFVDYDADAGTGTLRIDGADELDTGNAEHVLTTGTMDAGASSTFLVGSNTAAGALYLAGRAGFCGMRDIDGLTWSDFMQTDGTPKPLDESTWTEWGARPLYWHEAAKMNENKGSAGAMTANGTITLASAIP